MCYRIGSIKKTKLPVSNIKYTQYWFSRLFCVWNTDETQDIKTYFRFKSILWIIFPYYQVYENGELNVFDQEPNKKSVDGHLKGEKMSSN